MSPYLSHFVGPKLGKVNWKSGVPFNYDAFFINNKGSGLKFYTNYHFETMKPPNKFKPYIQCKICAFISVVEVRMKKVLT